MTRFGVVSSPFRSAIPTLWLEVWSCCWCRQQRSSSRASPPIAPAGRSSMWDWVRRSPNGWRSWPSCLPLARGWWCWGKAKAQNWPQAWRIVAPQFHLSRACQHRLRGLQRQPIAGSGGLHHSGVGSRDPLELIGRLLLSGCSPILPLAPWINTVQRGSAGPFSTRQRPTAIGAIQAAQARPA